MYKYQLSKMLELKSVNNANKIIEDEIVKFQMRNKLVIPEDLREYFKLLKKTKSEYNEKLYRFFPIGEFKSINDELKNFNGIPDYSNIVNTLKDYESYFVFADYMFHMFSYSIRLYNNESNKNEVYIICGDEYKMIATSFTDFVNLYASNSMELQFSD